MLAAWTIPRLQSRRDWRRRLRCALEGHISSYGETWWRTAKTTCSQAQTHAVDLVRSSSPIPTSQMASSVTYGSGILIDANAGSSTSKQPNSISPPSVLPSEHLQLAQPGRLVFGKASNLVQHAKLLPISLGALGNQGATHPGLAVHQPSMDMHMSIQSALKHHRLPWNMHHSLPLGLAWRPFTNSARITMGLACDGALATRSRRGSSARKPAECTDHRPRAGPSRNCLATRGRGVEPHVASSPMRIRILLVIAG
mmetsp:Transcript_3181/g.9686  ORF Transcript_3181/g.9686 Transcript_3181/m.9686 type:complete len:255 (-) Transcript_3181:261-1025(-)